MAITYLLANCALLGGLILLPQARRYVFAALVVLVVILELADRAKRPAQVQDKLFVAAVALLLGGFVAWVLDIMRITCSPESWLQGHALWHVAGALAAWLLYRYLQTARTARV